MKKTFLLLLLMHSFAFSFAQNIGLFNTYVDVAVSSSGKVVAVGQGDIGSGYMITSLPSLAPGWSQVAAVEWQGEQFIVVGSKVMRFNINGTVDPSFGSGGTVTGLSGTDLEVLCDGRVLVAGGSMVRLLPDGTPDPTFGVNGQAVAPFSITEIALAPDGKIYAIGTWNIARFLADGTLDPSFVQATLPSIYIELRELAVQADGKPVVVGTYDASPTNSNLNLLRFQVNGTLDPAFSHDGWLTLDMNGLRDQGVDIRIQSDGKILVLGTGLLFQCPCPAVGNYAYMLARFLANGTLDTGFGEPTTLPVYNVSPPTVLTFNGVGKTVMGSFLRATAMDLYGGSIYVAGGTTPEGRGQGSFVFMDTLQNDGAPLEFASGFAVSIPAAYALPQGVQPNTVYRGYAPASSITLTAQVPAGNYTYAWSTGSTAASLTVAPTATTTYMVTVTNAYGCTSTASITVQVADVRCGNGGDKVQVCQVSGGSGKSHNICIAPSAVPAHLKKGSYLGSCSVAAPSMVARDKKIEPEAYGVKVINNPTATQFTLDIQSPNLSDKVTVSVYDASGSLKETRMLPPNNRMDIGGLYPKGVYIAEIVQGSYRQVVRLVKLK